MTKRKDGKDKRSGNYNAFDGGMSHAEIAETLNISRNMVWLIEDAALKKLARKYKLLKPFLTNENDNNI